MAAPASTTVEVPPNLAIFLDDPKDGKTAKEYDSNFMDQLLSGFPGGNIASRNLRFSWIRWSGSVLPRVWMTVVFWTLYSTMIALIAELGGYRQTMSAPSAAPVSLIGFAVSLLLGFRTNSAYERWYEGRKLFETACARVREMVRWWVVFFPPKNEEERGRQLAAARCAVGFVYSLMYHLRDQNPMEHKECVDLIPREKNGSLAIETSDPSVPRYYFETTVERAITGIKTQNGKTGKNMTAFHMPGTWRNPHQWAVPGQMITLLYSYWDTLNVSKASPGLLTDLANTQVSLERILSTPMPPIYSIHLKMVLTLYFLTLPYQYMNFGYWLIPLTALAAFVMWGFEAMGLELENPFGFDPNDLPLSEICATLRRDIDFFMEHPISGAMDWHTDAVAVSAEDIARDVMAENNLTAADLRKTLAHLDQNDAAKIAAIKAAQEAKAAAAAEATLEVAKDK